MFAHCPIKMASLCWTKMGAKIRDLEMLTMSYDDTARRNYWTDQLDKAYAFIMKGLEVTVAECGERLVSLVDAVERAGVDVVFSGRPHVHGLPRLFVLREGLIDNFLNAVRRLNQQGWVLRVEDGYRSRTMQKGVGLMPFLFDDILHKVVWELEGRLPDPDFLFKRMLTLVAQIPKCAPHMSGAAIDMSVLDRSTGAEVDRGAPYLEISEITPINTPFVSAEARATGAKSPRSCGRAVSPSIPSNSGTTAVAKCWKKSFRARAGPYGMGPSITIQPRGR